MIRDSVAYGKIMEDSKADALKNFIFSLWIGFLFIGNLTGWANNIARIIKGVEDQFGYLFWGNLLSLNLLKIILSSTIITVSAVVYAYLSRKTKYRAYFLLGLAIYLFAPIILLVIILIRGIPLYLIDLREIFIPDPIFKDFYIALFIIQLIFIVFAVRLGQLIGLRINYLSEEDGTKGTIYGIRKLYWVLFIIPPTNMLISTSITASTRGFYNTYKDIVSGTYDKGFEGLVGIIFIPIIALYIASAIIRQGIVYLRDTKITRLGKIIRLVILYLIIPLIFFYFFG